MLQLEQHIELAEKKNSKQFSFFKVRETMLDNIVKLVLQVVKLDFNIYAYM